VRTVSARDTFSSGRPVDHGLLSITGYTERLSYLPGESVSVHASSIHPTGSLRLVRLGHDGKRFTTAPVTEPLAISLGHREVNLESHGVVDTLHLPSAPLAVRTWAWVSLLPDVAREATLLVVEGLRLAIDSTGRVVFTIGGNKLESKSPLLLRRWYYLIAGLDATGKPFVIVRPQRWGVWDSLPERVSGSTAVPWSSCSGTLTIGRGFNGKLEAVSIGQSEDEAEQDALRLDFSRGISRWTLHDARGVAVGRLVGLPTRAVTGRRWDGSQDDWRTAHDHYAAVYFHTDDQGDQQWPVTAEVTLPEDLPNGAYAIELSAGGTVDHFPIVVRRNDEQKAPLLVLLPSMAYLAYTAEHHTDEQLLWPIKCEEVAAKFGRANDYHSMYDSHADGSPVVLCSVRRPLLCLRPDHYLRFAGCEHGFSADLHLLGWLSRQGFAFDVVTDHDLDIEGVKLLERYKGVLTGGHPEYVSARVLDALQAYLGTGGNLAYLGGNGFCLMTALDPGDPTIMEMRRCAADMRWEGGAGEDHLQLTGMPAGLWNARGRMQFAMVGVSWNATGMVEGAPYRRTPASFDPRVAHLFEGIGQNEPIGEKGAFLGAAASYEVDFANVVMGTPPHALVIATAAIAGNFFYAPFPTLQAVGSENEATRRRADMVYFETGNGGAVFSASSIGWNGALSHHDDQNAASRLTANVLRSFIG
jgi:N,N-dimethylformamidase beta subunit-like protein